MVLRCDLTFGKFGSRKVLCRGLDVLQERIMTLWPVKCSFLFFVIKAQDCSVRSCHLIAWVPRFETVWLVVTTSTRYLPDRYLKNLHARSTETIF
jgi:hypothetical protein